MSDDHAGIAEANCLHDFRELYKRDRFLAFQTEMVLARMSLFAQTATNPKEGDESLAGVNKTLERLKRTLEHVATLRAKGETGLPGI